MAVPVAPLTESERGEANRGASGTDRPLTPQELYAVEKEKRRLHPRPAMQAAANAYAELLERDREAGRGGRPKGSKNGGNSLAGQLTNRGRPQINATRTDPTDLTPYLGYFTGRSA